ncbi:MAG: prolyl oligopeptidase family serine peptidase [Acidobacteria bacterium]|nr:prolyl oligopeptidase family serine peptidase [Acidobacteriota bacterium]
MKRTGETDSRGAGFILRRASARPSADANFCNLILVALTACTLLAQQTEQPPYKPTAEQISAVRAKMAQLAGRITAIPSRHRHTDVMADVEIFHKAADFILRHPEEFLTKAYYDNTLKTLDSGMARASELASGPPSWPSRKGRTVRAYYSKVDGSTQPYTVIVPDTYAGAPMRLDVVLHGRNARLNEVSFIADAEWGRPVTPLPDRIELHIYGRTNNAYRWAGESDVFEALAAVERNYKIDRARIVLRGFSMGGAGTWHIGLQHPHRWAAIEAGAGFSETRLYAKQEKAPEVEQRAWSIYDAYLYARNALIVPTVGYGSIDDPQLQASTNIRNQLLAEKIEPESIPALFLTGPKIGHRFAPESKKISEEFLTKALAKPRSLDNVKFVTHTTRYGECGWFRVDGMAKLYERAEVEASRNRRHAMITTKNVTHLGLDGIESVEIDGQTIKGSPKLIELRMGKWTAAKSNNKELRKRSGLQGPIDDAFVDSFLCVRPTGTPRDAAANSLALQKLETFRANWDKFLRGDIRIKDDSNITDQDIAQHNLILFGDPGSNKLIARVMARLPIKWEPAKIEIDGRTSTAPGQLLAMIYPNPLNPAKYVVLNSGHTFGEKEFKGTNALLFPRLGDWAVIGPDGVPFTAGFFDSRWKAE